MREHFNHRYSLIISIYIHDNIGATWMRTMYITIK